MKKKLFHWGMAMLCLTTTAAMADTYEHRAPSAPVNDHTAASAAARTVRLRVVQTSDVHGHFFPYDFTEGQPMKGSLARVNHYTKHLRETYGDRLLLIDNGDILQGQPISYWSNIVAADETNIAAQVVNYMGYDAQTFGNHDVETGHEVYDKWIAEVRCPMLGANIVDTKTDRPYVKPYAIIVRDGVKIAVLGMLTPTIPCWLNESLWQGLTFREMVSCARQWVTYIKEVEHADLVFGLFHSGKDGGITMDGGIEEDASERVAREVPGFDIVFFGHDHRQHSGWVVNSAGQRVLMLDPSCFAQNVADAQIELTYEQGRLTKKNIMGHIVSVADEPVDSEMVAHFRPLTDRVKAYTGRRIGRFESTVSTRDSYFGNSAFTDFIHNVQLRLSGADVSFNAPLFFDAQIDAGDITVADMFKLYRYENRLYILNMTGREIRKHLEESYDRWTNTMASADDLLLLLNPEAKGDQPYARLRNFSFNFDSAAGIDYEVDVTKPDGQKVRILGMSNGRPFDEAKTYRVVMNSYRGNGGGELLTKGAGIPKDELDNRIVYQSPLDLRHYLMEEIERMGTVDPQPNHNWRFVPEEWTGPAAKRDRQLLFDE